MNLRNSLSALALLFTPTLAFAHPGHGSSGLLAGLGHPLGGTGARGCLNRSARERDLLRGRGRAC